MNAILGIPLTALLVCLLGVAALSITGTGDVVSDTTSLGAALGSVVALLVFVSTVGDKWESSKRALLAPDVSVWIAGTFTQERWHVGKALLESIEKTDLAFEVLNVGITSKSLVYVIVTLALLVGFAFV